MPQVPRCLLPLGCCVAFPLAAQTPPVFIDLASDTARQVVVDREPGQYLGHPTTVLLEDGRTILAVYPKGHGGGAIVMKRSSDGGRTWGERLPVPASWATSKEVPTIYRVVDRGGVRRLLLFSGLYPMRMARSDDDGRSWSELEPIGDFGGIVAMASLERLADGSHMALFHDDGRFIRGEGEAGRFFVYKTLSQDGGLTWSAPEVIASLADADLCEPGLVRSPDGSQIAVLLRENARRHESFVIFSDDEGRSWSEPRELPPTLTGDRHVAGYAPDGRLFITFRDQGADSPTKGDWVGWVGRYQDLVQGRPGQYRVRLMDNRHAWDAAYPGLELLPDGTFVTTTYGYWTEGEQPYIVSVRFRMEELDQLAEGRSCDSSRSTRAEQFPPRVALVTSFRLATLELPLGAPRTGYEVRGRARRAPDDGSHGGGPSSAGRRPDPRPTGGGGLRMPFSFGPP